MNLRHLLILALACAASLTLFDSPLVAQQPSKKIAFLVGVERYQKRGFNNLEFAEDDMQALADTLQEQGFTVSLLLGSSEGKQAATAENITTQFRDSFVPLMADLGKNDISLIAFAGHGRHSRKTVDNQIKEDHFYCPVDSHDSNSDSWISISDLIDTVESESGSENNLFLVDACRDNPSRGRGVDGSGFTLNRNAVAVLFASSYGEQAYEPTSLKHGLFTYYVLQGLTGKAKNYDGVVTWDSLAGYVKSNVTNKSSELNRTGEINGTQRPNGMGSLSGISPVLASKFGGTAPKATITNTVNMTFRRIKSGSFNMGSRESAADVARAFGEDAETFVNEHPLRRVNITAPFYMAENEVTVGQFRQFVRDSGYRTAAEKGNAGEAATPVGINAGATWQNPFGNQYQPQENFPVAVVTYYDAVAYCQWLSRKEGKRYRLPTDEEWEYAARAGTETRYWNGDSSTQLVQVANVADRSHKTADNLKIRDWVDADDGFELYAPVGSYRPNPWGLNDIHGNVWEWCEVADLNSLKIDDTRNIAVIRGGCLY